MNYDFSPRGTGRSYLRKHPAFGLRAFYKSHADRAANRLSWTVQFKLRANKGTGQVRLFSFCFAYIAEDRARQIRDYLRACVDGGLIHNPQSWDKACQAARAEMLAKGWIIKGPHGKNILPEQTPA